MSNSKAISVRLTDEQIARLDRAATKAKLSRAEMAAQLLETAIRLTEFPYIEFKDFGAGLEAFVTGTRLRVWWVELLARDYDFDVPKIASHYNLPESTIRAVLAYTAAFHDEIEDDIAEYYRRSDELQREIVSQESRAAGLAVDAPAS